MNGLEQFLGVIKVAEQPLSTGSTAYYMDGGKGTSKKLDLRKHVGLGECHCCDYFLPGEKFVTLIEETQLLKTEQTIREEYEHLNETEKTKRVNKHIQNKMQLKAYGAMLVLCRLAMKCASARDLLHGRKYQFWLVVSSIDTQGEARYFDSMKDDLRGALTQVLSKELLGDVDVLSAETLAKRLSGSATTP